MLTNDALTNMHALPYLNAETLKKSAPLGEHIGCMPIGTL